MSTIIWSPGMSLASIEKLVILEAYRFFRSNKTATATALGIAIRTLDNKLQQYEEDDQIETQKAKDELQRRTEFLARQRGNPPNNIGIPYSPNEAQKNIHGSSSGLHMESVVNASSQPTVPMSERKEVQSVLPEHASQGGKTKRR